MASVGACLMRCKKTTWKKECTLTKRKRFQFRLLSNKKRSFLSNCHSIIYLSTTLRSVDLNSTTMSHKRRRLPRRLIRQQRTWRTSNSFLTIQRHWPRSRWIVAWTTHRMCAAWATSTSTNNSSSNSTMLRKRRGRIKCCSTSHLSRVKWWSSTVIVVVPEVSSHKPSRSI